MTTFADSLCENCFKPIGNFVLLLIFGVFILVAVVIKVIFRIDRQSQHTRGIEHDCKASPFAKGD